MRVNQVMVKSSSRTGSGGSLPSAPTGLVDLRSNDNWSESKPSVTAAAPDADHHGDPVFGDGRERPRRNGAM